MTADIDLSGAIPDSRGINLYRADRDAAALFAHYLPRPLFRHLAATVVQQAHLSPLPVAQAPVYWQHDHALWLYPAPHMVVLGDRTEQQALAKFEDTELVNPGCFADDGSFAVYKPATRQVQFSVVP